MITVEICYRNYWLDFYGKDFSYLNQLENKSKDNVLIFGDSFSAQQQSYVNQWRELDTTRTIYNLSLPGTYPGISKYYAPYYIKKLKPKLVICQLYLGNDLIDASYPINWSKLSMLRNVYWSIANHFHFLRFINYRLATISSQLNTDFNEKLLSNNSAISEFSVENYSPRTKMLIHSNPNYLNETYYLNSTSSRKSLSEIINDLKEIKALTEPHSEFKILVIPHAVSVSNRYRSQYIELGLHEFTPSSNYPIINELLSEFGESTIIDSHGALISLENNGHHVFYENDDHLNKTGHAGVTQLILNEL